MKNYRRIKEMCMHAFILKRVSTNSAGRYGCLTSDTIPALSIKDGA